MSEDKRITQLEICYAGMAADMKHVVTVVDELKSMVMAVAKLETICAACMARQDERWEGHRRIHDQVATIDDLARVGDRVADYKVQANGTATRLRATNNQLTETRIGLAKTMASGAGGGAVLFGLLELAKYLLA